MILNDYDQLIFEISSPGHVAYDLPTQDVPEYDLSKDLESDYQRKEDICHIV